MRSWPRSTSFGATVFVASFAFHRELLACSPILSSRSRNSGLRFLRSGSGRLHPDEAERLADAAGAPVLMGLSATEAGAIAHDPLPPAPRRRGGVGLPVLDEVGVLASDGVSVTRYGQGEIVVRGPTVFDGYFDDPALTAKSFAGDWFRTGDLGRIDDDGFVFVTGRCKEVINRGGEKISPLEVDAVLETLPGVREAATFSVRHPTLGEEVVAAVVRPPARRWTLPPWCRRRAKRSGRRVCRAVPSFSIACPAPRPASCFVWSSPNDSPPSSGTTRSYPAGHCPSRPSTGISRRSSGAYGARSCGGRTSTRPTTSFSRAATR